MLRSAAVQPELVAVPERIETERLVLRCYEADDAVALWEAIEESRDDMRPWLNFWPSRESLDAVRVEVARLRAMWITRERLAFGMFLRATGEYLGEAVLFELRWGVPAFNLGHLLRRSAQRHGYMQEAVERVARLALEDLGAHRLEARVDTRNHRSRRVLERLQFQHEGTLHNIGRHANGELFDSDVFALVRSRPRVDRSPSQ